MTQNAFTYFAFVSYSHKDEKWARWIQTALERYRLPATVRKEAGKTLPERIRPVFRDATDLGVGKLVDNLRQELEQSKFLIVVCSPNSARSNTEGKHWVNEEVVRFCELGRADRIIPVIVGGTKETAYCPKLEEEDILGLDATKHSRERILNDLVAKILGLRPDELWRREERRLRAKRRRRVFGAFLVSAVLVLGGFMAWDSTRTVCNHYADYVDSFGLPEGIFPLEKRSLPHRNCHYRFVYRGLQKADSPHADSADWNIWNCFGFRRRLVRVVQANSLGYPCTRAEQAFADRPKIQDFKYDGSRLREILQGRGDGDGRITSLERRVELYNDEGDNDEWIVNGLLKFFSQESPRSMAYSASSALPPIERRGFAQQAEIVQHALVRDSQGRIRQRLFLNSSFSNVPDGDGLYGFEYEYDEWGRETSRWQLGRVHNGFQRLPNKTGVAGVLHEYCGMNQEKTRYVNEVGGAVLGPDGWAICERAFDRFGNLTVASYFGVDGKPIQNKDGFAEIRWEYDGGGNAKKAWLFGLDGKPVLCRDGYAEVRLDHDEYGNTTTLSYFGLDGKPATCKDGFSESKWEYDEYGNIKQINYFGVDGKSALDKNGVAEVRWAYDGHGNTVEELCLGTDGKPTLHKDGYSGIYFEYDKRGNRTKALYVGTDGKPLMLEDGYAEVHWKHDVRGNTTDELYFDATGNPTLHKDGNAEIRCEYDERGNMTKQAYFGINGEPTLHRNGYAEVRMEYDEHGNRTKLSCLGPDGMPALHKNGYVSMCWQYDDCGNVVKATYFDSNGQPTLHMSGIAETRWEYDERGNQLKETYFDAQGSLTSDLNGIAEIHFTWDLNGNLKKIEYCNESGQSLQEVVASTAIVEGSAASAFGVQAGDIWCRLGPYDILESEDTLDADEAVSACRNTEKEFVVARKSGDDYEIHAFRFPAGPMGIHYEATIIADMDKIKSAYTAHLETHSRKGQ